MNIVQSVNGNCPRGEIGYKQTMEGGKGEQRIGEDGKEEGRRVVGRKERKGAGL